MIMINVNNRESTKIEAFPYKGNPLKVKDVYIRWLSQVGPEAARDYGLRFFTIGPAGYIPIHNHLYCQTMYYVKRAVMRYIS